MIPPLVTVLPIEYEVSDTVISKAGLTEEVTCSLGRSYLEPQIGM